MHFQFYVTIGCDARVSQQSYDMNMHEAWSGLIDAKYNALQPCFLKCSISIA